MSCTITKLTEHTGAEVRGVDLREPLDDATHAALNRAFVDHHVLVIRDQDYTPEQFKRAAQVFGALFDAAAYMDLRRLPELFCGFARRERNAPTQYPVACSPQAWASATPLCLLQASLGLELLDKTGEVKFYRPMLPDFLDHVRLRNLRLSTGSVDLLLHRQDNNIAVTVTRRDGDVVVVTRY